MSCSRKTNRWPMCQFYGILNMAFINSYVIYTHNMFEAKLKPLSRSEYMKKLHFSLVQMQISERLEIPTLRNSVRENIASVLPHSTESSDGVCQQPKKAKRKICAFCPSFKRRMTKSICSKCKKSLCGEHKIELCASCMK